VLDTSKEYELSVFASAHSVAGEELDSSSVHYIGIVSYDIDGYEIRPWNFMKNPTAVDTTLAVDLKPGDMTMTLNDATGWYDGPDRERRSFVWYGYENSRGDIYPDYTYTRHTSLVAWDENGIEDNRIQLKVRWNGPLLRAGEPIRNAGISYQHNYRFLAPGHVTEKDLNLRALIGHINLSGKINLSKFRPGTHSIAALALADYTDTGTALTLDDFTVSCRNRPDKKITGD
jgi:hypothetical protein